jgi:hypothetical protein
LIDFGNEFPKKSSQKTFSKYKANSKYINVMIAALKIIKEVKPFRLSK